MKTPNKSTINLTLFCVLTASIIGSILPAKAIDIPSPPNNQETTSKFDDPEKFTGGCGPAVGGETDYKNVDNDFKLNYDLNDTNDDADNDSSSSGGASYSIKTKNGVSYSFKL